MLICFLAALLLLFAASASAEIPGETVTITFRITDNSQHAISARIGMEFDTGVFEFVGAEIISPDVLSKAPDTAQSKFGLLNMGGLATGDVGTITLRIKESAKAGKHEIKPVVDSVYNVKRESVELTVAGGTITVNHVWDDGRVTVEATCYTEGVMTYYCFYCDAKRTQAIPVTKHREGAPIVTKAATCTADGEQVYPCDICHDTLRTEAIPATGHAEGDTVITQEATCVAAGVLVTQCANCGKTIHSDAIPATGHAWDEGVITKQPTITEEGVTTYTCKACGVTYTESIPVIPVLCVPGDVNETGAVDILDALLILQHSVGWNVTINEANADVDASGTVNILDALLVLQFSVGWDVELL